MTKHERAAKSGVAAYLLGRRDPVLLFDVCVQADQTATQSGKKTELYPSLYDYSDLLPSGWHTQWLQVRRGGDSLLYAVPPGWQPGQSKSNSLLLGGGTLIPAQHVMG